MKSLRRDETGAIPFAKLLIIGSVIAVAAILIMLVLSVVPAGDKEDTKLFYCPEDKTYVDDPLKCPSGHPLSLGVYSTIIRVTFLDGTTATLTKQTLFDALTLRYQNKDVSSFLFMSSYATGDAAMRVRVRPEISLEIASLNTIVRGTTGDFVDKTIPKGTTTNLFSMSLDASFFGGVLDGTYVLKFVSHFLPLEVLKDDGTVEASKEATISHSLDVSVVSGGGGGGGCNKPICVAPLVGELSDPEFQVF